MKKIVALVLSLVMALALCTTAFADVPLWTTANGGVNTVDTYSMDNTKYGPDTMTYHAAKDPTYNNDGVPTAAGNIAYYTFASDATKLYVMSTAYTDKADFAVKVADANVATGEQTTPDAMYYMIKVDTVSYAYTGAKFATWGTKCEQYAKPADADKVTYIQVTNGDVKGNVYATKADAVDTPFDNVLVDGVIYSSASNVALDTIKHQWVATKWDAKSVATEYTCSVCKTVGKVVASPFDPAVKGHTVVQLGPKTYIYFDYDATTGTGSAADGKGTSSPKTFDAGIAMYVGMSLMSVAGSAVVIGKKKEF